MTNTALEAAKTEIDIWIKENKNNHYIANQKRSCLVERSVQKDQLGRYPSFPARDRQEQLAGRIFRLKKKPSPSHQCALPIGEIIHKLTSQNYILFTN